MFTYFYSLHPHLYLLDTFSLILFSTFLPTSIIYLFYLTEPWSKVFYLDVGRRDFGVLEPRRRLRRRTMAREHARQVRGPRSSPHLLRHPRHQHPELERRARVLQSLRPNLLT